MGPSPMTPAAPPTGQRPPPLRERAPTGSGSRPRGGPDVDTGDEGCYFSPSMTQALICVVIRARAIFRPSGDKWCIPTQGLVKSRLA